MGMAWAEVNCGRVSYGYIHCTLWSWSICICASLVSSAFYDVEAHFTGVGGLDRSRDTSTHGHYSHGSNPQSQTVFKNVCSSGLVMGRVHRWPKQKRLRWQNHPTRLVLKESSVISWAIMGNLFRPILCDDVTILIISTLKPFAMT